ncbi:unnamed protein product [Dovyalis caffra]|uniref:Nitrite/sulphite reductase 4Fe-4S domain-containing protein n=1 Tax=Dovyalis caffra TaxID=77055 RepID=A0AAV1RCL8_9ROSI|nr:unnamed protein product [Dovyalis caffra]
MEQISLIHQSPSMELNSCLGSSKLQSLCQQITLDLLTNDVGVVVVTDADGEPQGFNIYVGGGMGRTHRLETTFPRLAEPLGYVPKEDILYAGDGGLFCGLHVDSGRNIILCVIRKAWKRPITTALAQAGLLQPKYVDPLNLTAMACPALPLCPLAITEAERGIPDILKCVRAVFEKVGLKYNESVVIMATGCPNGYARPYMAELGFVGDGPNSYQLWLGGTPNQTSLARTFMNKVKIHDLETVLEPLFYSWKRKRQSKESFGDFTNRVWVEKWDGVVATRPTYNLILFTDKDTYEKMDELAKLQNKTAHQLAMEVIRNYAAARQNGKGE